MKKTLGTLVLVAAMLAVMVPVAFAQLGDCDNSSFSIQNLGTAQATVTVTFYNEAGASFVPTPLDGSGTTNPFALDAGAQYQVYVPGIGTLPDGRYSVVIESTEPVAVIANLIGYTGNCGAGNWPAFNGSYSGFDAGAATYYLPSVVYAFSNWNSLISVQNVTADPIDVDITIKGDPSGDVLKSYSAVPGFSSVHLDLQTEGAGLGLAGNLNGSAIVEATGAVVVTDNQSNYGGGFGLTQSYNGFASGGTTFYAPALYRMFPAAGAWRSSINIQNIGSGPTDVTLSFSDGGTPMTCPALAAGASCLLLMVNRTDGPTSFAGTITSSAEDIVAIVNASNGNKKEAQTYSAIAGGGTAATVNFPLVMDHFPNGTGGWDTDFLVQNIGTSDCSALTVDYSDDASTGAIGPTYTIAGPFAPGAAQSVYTPGDTNLPANWYSGSVAVTCDNGQPVGGIVNETNRIQSTSNGDWSMSYNGF
jgi:hypothetical protein